MLTLPEKLLLLALDDTKGSVVACGSMALPFGLAGAVLVELQVRDRIDVQEKTVHVVDSTPTGDLILDEALRNISSAKKPRNAQHWVASNNRLVSSLRERLLDRLVDADILRRETHEVLWVFHFDRYPTKEEHPEQVIRRALEETLFEGQPPTDDTAALLCLVHACSLGKEVFPGWPPGETKRRLKAFAESDAMAKAVSDSVAAVTAVVMSVVMTTMLTSTVYNQ